MGNSMDLFAFGLESPSLLLFFGDLTAARAGFAKVNGVHKRMLALVRQGAASAERCVPVSRKKVLLTRPRAECAYTVPQVLL